MITRKRKRDLDERRAGLPLTEKNLNSLNAMPRRAKEALHAPEEGNDASSTAGSSRVDERLGAHRIFMDREHAVMPPSVAELVENVKKRRSRAGLNDVTPKSKRAAERWKRTNLWNETDAMATLENIFGYRGEDEAIELEGIPEIFRTRGKLFQAGTLPVRDAQDNEILRIALEDAGVPSTPKPDLTYGYDSKAFSQDERDILKSLPRDCLVIRDEPWLPYWIVEWKAKVPGGSMWQAQLQARRDGAAAVNAMHNFYKTLGVDADPGQTAVFTTCIDSDTVWIRVHWRNVDTNGDVSYEGEVVESGFIHKSGDVFDTRSILLEILAWAKGQRLEKLHDALSAGRDSLVICRSPKKNQGLATPTPSVDTDGSGSAGVKRRRIG